MQRGQAFAGLNDRLGQTARHAGIAVQPTDRFHAFATVATPDTPKQHAEAHRTAKNGQITNDSLAVLMRG
ncbi:hypothetical protein D3C87_1780440 [compost metagenome]